MPGLSFKRRHWRDHWAEMLLVSGAVTAYFTTRGFTESDPTRALRNAGQVVSLERWIHLYQEPRLQSLVLGHERMVTILNWIYIWLHWPAILAVLIWLLRSRPEPYRLLRNAMFLSGAIGLVVFILYPGAPPRLAGLGLADTVAAQSQAYRVLQPPAFVNQYAALPSLHVGWNLLLGIFLIRHARHVALRLFGLLSPAAMAVAVVLTANHYLLDVLVGVVVALVGLALAGRLMRSAPTPDVPPGPGPMAPRGQDLGPCRPQPGTRDVLLSGGGTPSW